MRTAVAAGALDRGRRRPDHAAVTPAAFRRLALSLPDTSEGAHQGHPDFRAHGRIFATLQPTGRAPRSAASPRHR